jgi:acetyl esterase/lipase
VSPHRSWTRTLVLLSVVLEIPLLARATRALTGTPTIESLVIDGVPVELVVPAGDGPWPAFHFMNGAHPERRREPIVQRVSNGLARAGFIVVVPDLPGLGEEVLTQRTFSAARSVTLAVAQRPDVRQGRIALAGASVGAGIALVTAADPDVADAVSVVAAIVPFADIERMTGLATTSHYLANGTATRYELTPLMRRVVAKSLVATLPHEAERTSLLTLLGAQDPEDLDGLRCLAVAARSCGADAQTVVDLLLNEDPERFPAFYKALPPHLSETLSAISPANCASEVRAPVEVIAPPADPYFPLPEAETVVRLVPDGRLTVTRVLDHTRPSLTLSRLGDLIRFLGWVRRCLARAAA